MSKGQKGTKNGIWFRLFGPAPLAPCYWCHQMLTFKESTLDHEPPRSMGGEKKKAVIACDDCNQRRNSLVQKLVARGVDLYG